MVASNRSSAFSGITPDRKRQPEQQVGIHEYLIEEDEMGDSSAQTLLLGYLEAVLRALFGVDGPFVARNLTMYHPAIQNSQKMISPDIALFLGIPLSQEERRHLSSWDMRPSRPSRSQGRRQDRLRSVEAEQGLKQSTAPGRRCPPVMIEISSESTWEKDILMDLAAKVAIYGRMGVQLYLAYDPNDPPVWRGVEGRLLGWQYDAQGEPHLLEADERGWLWCAELESWVGEDGHMLRLYDPVGNQRLTGEARAEQRAEQAEARAERAEERAERLLRLLRERGIEPDEPSL